MSQQFLDPENSTTNGTWRPDTKLPDDVRTFGRYPNISDWLPGDLLLFHKPNQRSLISNLIIRAQKTGFDDDHARWHHAAVYVGDGELCEASIIPGVQHAPIHRYVGKHWIRVRRDPTLNLDQRYKIAVRSLTRLREAYGIGSALKLGIRSLFGSWKPTRMALSSQGVICSRLYELAYRSATETVVFNKVDDAPIIPAELSLTDKLQDVAVFWVDIVRH